MDQLSKQERLQLAIEAFNNSNQIRKMTRQYDAVVTTLIVV